MNQWKVTCWDYDSEVERIVHVSANDRYEATEKAIDLLVDSGVHNGWIKGAERV